MSRRNPVFGLVSADFDVAEIPTKRLLEAQPGQRRGPHAREEAERRAGHQFRLFGEHSHHEFRDRGDRKNGNRRRRIEFFAQAGFDRRAKREVFLVLRAAGEGCQRFALVVACTLAEVETSEPRLHIARSDFVKHVGNRRN